jgi:hypothetical protein
MLVAAVSLKTVVAVGDTVVLLIRTMYEVPLALLTATYAVAPSLSKMALPVCRTSAAPKVEGWS